jgi:hypothetical protein
MEMLKEAIKVRGAAKDGLPEALAGTLQSLAMLEINVGARRLTCSSGWLISRRFSACPPDENWSVSSRPIEDYPAGSAKTRQQRLFAFELRR